jgi:peptidoglycan/xylan/chitin deacetylase (PgdA/CDA1 family)
MRRRLKNTGRHKRILALVAVLLAAASLAAGTFVGSIYRLPVLMYHSIEHAKNRSDKLTVSPEAFERQLAFLRGHRYNVIPLADAVDYIRQRKRPPPRTVAITIDDGYENNYLYVYPLLKKYKMPATIFVITGFVGREGFLSWNQMREMSDSGLVDIESHTKLHYWLTGLADDRLKDELASSRAVLESRLGKKVPFVCYPMGAYDGRVKAAARSAGYKAAFATKPTRLTPNYDVYEIKRVRISRTSDNMFVFWIKISGYHAFFRLLQADYREIPYIIWRHAKGS